jgi:alpha-2-macroglobulin
MKTNSQAVIQSRLGWIVLLFAMTWLASCVQRTPTSGEKNDPAWANVIAAHTVGPVTRRSTIRISFSQEMVAADSIGKERNDLLKFDPSVKGHARFDTPRELVWTPDEQLEGGATYRIEVIAKGLKGVPANTSNYVFTLQVQAADFDVHIEPLNSNAGLIAQDANQMALSGVITTADSESNEGVEGVLKAEFLGKPIQLQWQHSASGREHRFTTIVMRQQQAEQVTLSWDGASIHAKSKGQKQVYVPAQHEFLVTGVSLANDTSDRRIDVTFSESLAHNQDLRGLVTLSMGTPRFRIESNLLRVYLEEKNGQALEGDLQLTLADSIRSESGQTLKKPSQHTLTIASAKPQLRFVGGGTILPEADSMSIPIEAVNLRAIRVTAFRVYNDNLPQFLQVNNLDGQRELARVGRNLWRKRIRLSAASDNKPGHQWQRYSLDVTELLKKYPGNLIRLQVSFTRSDIVYDCPSLDSKKDDDTETPLKDADTNEEADASAWDYYQDPGEYEGEEMNWNERENPCKRAYYSYNQNIRAGRNLLVSNLGLIAKRDQSGKLLVVATDLRSAESLSGVQVKAFNYQNQLIATQSTDSNGMAQFETAINPYLLVADKGGQKGYLKTAQGLALPTSHFDVGGERVVEGVKGTLYAERGVWRPGDDIYLTLVVQGQSKEKNLPTNHPVKLELYDPRNQLSQTVVNTTPVDGFYSFTLKTAEDSPTGEWVAKATFGGVTFSKALRVETVMPNRLKMELQWDSKGAQDVIDASVPIKGQLSSQWLTGATAATLRADVNVRMSKGKTLFTQFGDFVFDDATRDFSNDPQTVFDGKLDESGHATFDHSLDFNQKAPGVLNATFVTRVFEPSGAFSVQRTTQSVSPYKQYVGLKMPKGDVARNMLLTDTTHTVELASLSSDGKPVSLKKISVAVYKIRWRWWWDQSGDSLAQYATAEEMKSAVTGDTTTVNGVGKWTFAVKYPEWGRYLIRACDSAGGHCASQAFYIDWPAWAGRPQDQSGPGANALTLTADKAEYQIGETAKIDLPESAQGRVLLTVENGSRILDAKWINVVDKDKASRRIEIPLTSAMTPNVYVNVSLLQPHRGKSNDRPLRMYGIVPVKVTDPKTHLAPVLTVPEEWAPESKAVVKVSESQGRAMTYTLALVDEGLLGLTNFKIPDLHDHFYKREALGISTWDLFDQVAGAYNAELDKLLALGGSDAAAADPDKNKSRFPPVVKFIGPFQLAAGKSATHEITLPKYVGAVRVMLVAGKESAYGSVEKSVFVRQPLMILPTLPRVVGPNEDVSIPVSVFAMNDSIRQVEITVEGDKLFAVQETGKTTVLFKGMGEQLGLLRMKTAMRLGQGELKFTATSGKHRATAVVNLAVRTPSTPMLEYEHKTLQPGETWDASLTPHGLLGTNTATLEVASIPPMNLQARLDYLIHYPHGCLEQTTSAAFPQLYLPALTKLDTARSEDIQTNINAAIARLRLFQQSHGGFSYWPTNDSGYTNTANFDPRATWSTNYAGHFLIEAERLGYHVPQSLRSGWLNFQRTAAQNWVPTHSPRAGHLLDQAYRLYTLALANQPEMGAMNRLREQSAMPIAARWILAAAYKLAGVNDAATALIQTAKIDSASVIPQYTYVDDTFGSQLRDQAMVLTSMVAMGQHNQAQPLVRAISESLSSRGWYSTQSLSYSLMAMAKFVGVESITTNDSVYSVDYEFANAKKSARSDAPVLNVDLGKTLEGSAPIKIKNTSKRTLFLTLVSRGVRPPGDEVASSSGLSLEVSYTDAQGNAIDVSKLRSGTDLIARVTVKNNEAFDVKNIALTQMVPSGWEIMNDRLDNVVTKADRSGDSRPEYDWYYSLYIKSREKTEYLDIRDDRVQRYFSLNPNEQVTFVTRLNAAYLGRFWLPATSVEAMYDATRNARSAGQWVQVVDRIQ